MHDWPQRRFVVPRCAGRQIRAQHFSELKGSVGLNQFCLRAETVLRGELIAPFFELSNRGNDFVVVEDILHESFDLIVVVKARLAAKEIRKCALGSLCLGAIVAFFFVAPLLVLVEVEIVVLLDVFLKQRCPLSGAEELDLRSKLFLLLREPFAVLCNDASTACSEVALENESDHVPYYKDPECLIPL